jgi:hypothetical protein
LPTLLSAGNYPPPTELDDTLISLDMGAAIKDIVAECSDLNGELQVGGWLIVASIFVPLLAREDRIAAWLGISRERARRMGVRLRVAGIWQWLRLAQDCYDGIMGEEPFSVNVHMTLYAGVACGKYDAWRGAKGEMLFSLPGKKQMPTLVDGNVCLRCGTTAKYTRNGDCVECVRRSVRASQARLRRSRAG